MTEKRIGVELRALHNLMKRRAEASAVHSDIHALTGTHGYVLGYLAHHQDREQYQRDIETAFSVRPSTATVILQTMEQNGLITREPAAHDARLKRIVLTEKALSLHRRVEAEHDETERLLRENLTAEELAVFFRVTEKLKATLDRRSTT